MALLPHEQLMGAPQQGVSQHVLVPTHFLEGFSCLAQSWVNGPSIPECQSTGITLSGRMTLLRVKCPRVVEAPIPPVHGFYRAFHNPQSLHIWLETQAKGAHGEDHDPNLTGKFPYLLSSQPHAVPYLTLASG